MGERNTCMGEAGQKTTEGRGCIASMGRRAILALLWAMAPAWSVAAGSLAAQQGLGPIPMQGEEGPIREAASTAAPKETPSGGLRGTPGEAAGSRSGSPQHQQPQQPVSDPQHPEQAHPPQPAMARRGDPVHRPDGILPPNDALDLLLEGHKARLDALAGRAPLPPTPLHPSGCGPHLAAVWTGLSPSVPMFTLFHRRPEELLVLRGPGPMVRLAEVAALERAVLHQQLSLVVILVPDLEPALTALPPGSPAKGTPAQRRTAALLGESHHLAATRDLPLAVAHGLEQRSQLFATSPLLRLYRAAGKFEVAVGVLQQGTLEIQWFAAWRHAWPVAAEAGQFIRLPELQPLIPRQNPAGARPPLHTLHRPKQPPPLPLDLPVRPPIR